MATVSVVIATHNSAGYIVPCLDSLLDMPSDVHTEIIVVDSASTDDTCSLLASRPDVQVLSLAQNVGFGAANNLGISRASGEYLFFLNPDTVVMPGALESLLGSLHRRPRCGLVGPRLVNDDGSLQASAGAAPTVVRTLVFAAGLHRLLPRDERARARLYAGLRAVMPLSADRLADHTVARQCDVVSGAAMLLRRRALPRGTAFDEGSFMYEEETVLCHRVRNEGWEVWFEPAGVVLHHGGASSPHTPRLAAEFYRNRLRFFRQYGTTSQCVGLLPAVVCGLMLRPLLALILPSGTESVLDETRYSMKTLRCLLAACPWIY
jgi:N-acetylglucosaminyl-diphospho-decaprenol L-rhamnosyltransferase